MRSENGQGSGEPLELGETLYIETKDGAEIAYEVVGILEDPDDGKSYAVLLHEPHDDEEGEFIVTDLEGNLVEDEELANEILTDFLEFAEAAGEGEESS